MLCRKRNSHENHFQGWRSLPAFLPESDFLPLIFFFQKYTDEQLSNIEAVKQSIAVKCPDYEKILRDLIISKQYETDINEEDIPEEIAELMMEIFAVDEEESEEPDETDKEILKAADSAASVDKEDQIDKAKEIIISLK